MPTAARKRREEEQQHNRREFATQANDRIWQALTGQPAPGPGPATTSAGFNAAPSPARVGDWGGTPPAAAGIPAAAVPWAAARPAVPAAVQAPRAPSAEYVAGAAQPSPPAVPAMPPPSYEQPRLFVDSDGRARAGFNMGEDGRRLGLAPTDAGGVPLGIGMVPVQGLSQGSAEVGRDLRLGPPAPMVLTPPPAPPTTADWARSANAIGGYKAPPMNAREAARMADKDATRAARWDQSGPTSAVNRAVNQIRSQGAALDALRRQTDEQIRLAQGTPQAAAGAAGVATYTPRADGPGPGEWTEAVRPASGATATARHPSGMTYNQALAMRIRAMPKKKGQIPPFVQAYVATLPAEEQRLTLAMYDRDDPGDPDTVAAMDPIIQFYQGQGSAGNQPAPAAVGATQAPVGKINKWQD